MFARYQELNSKPGNYFKREKLALKLTGLSFTGNESMAYKIYAFLFLSTIYSYPFLHLKDVFSQDFNTVADMLGYDFSLWIALVKALVMLRNRKQIGELLEKLEKEPYVANKERGGIVEEELVKNCTTITAAQTLTYWLCAILSVIFGNSYTLLKRLRSKDYHDWDFTYGPFTLFNETHSPNYELLWLYQSFCVASIGIHFTTVDVLAAAVLVHISYQFKILQHNITIIMSKSYERMMKDSSQKHLDASFSRIPWSYLKKSLTEKVQHHLAIIEVAKELEGIFSGLLLSVFMGTLGILCFMVFRASMVESNDYRMAGNLGEVSVICLQVFLNCYWGERVMYESQMVSRAAAEVDFVGADLRLQKGLILIMARSLHPVKITAGKFADICLATFLWIIRASYSSYMVLHSTQ